MSDTNILLIQLDVTKAIINEILADLALARELRSEGWVGELVSELAMYEREIKRLTTALENA